MQRGTHITNNSNNDDDSNNITTTNPMLSLKIIYIFSLQVLERKKYFESCRRRNNFFFRCGRFCDALTLYLSRQKILWGGEQTTPVIITHDSHKIDWNDWRMCVLFVLTYIFFFSEEGKQFYLNGMSPHECFSPSAHSFRKTHSVSLWRRKRERDGGKEIGGKIYIILFLPTLLT